jgi:predicted Fe-Mo cluster-binding NifX family protein
MRVAVPVWNGRVSPVFDAAGHLLIVEVFGHEAASVEGCELRQDCVQVLRELGVEVLICGAISNDLEERVLAAGIEVVAEIRGRVDDVIRAHAEDKLARPEFSMPGCHSRRRRPRGKPSAEPVSALEWR